VSFRFFSRFEHVVLRGEKLITGRLMSIRQEIFGPVLTVVKAKDLDDALALINRNRCERPTSSFLFQLCGPYSLVFLTDLIDRTPRW